MDIRTLRPQLPSLISDDHAEREKARLALFALDEDAVTLLVDEFFAGVSESMGLAMLRKVYHFEERRESWKRAAARGLLLNRDALDAGEVEELKLFAD